MEVAATFLEKHPIATVVFRFDDRRTFLWANTAFLKMYGYTYNEIIKLGGDDIVTKRCEFVPLDECRRFQHRRKDGSIIDIDLSVTVIQWEGEDVGLAAIADVSDLVHTQNSLTASEKRSLRVQTLSGVGVFEIDFRTGNRYWSEVLMHQVGHDVTVPLPKSTTRVLYHIYPADRDRVMYEYMKAEEECRPYSVDYRINRPDGSIIWINEQADFDYDEDGIPVRVLGTSLDITNRKEAEQKYVFASHYDQLTHLPNRDLFHKKASRCIEEAKTDNRSSGIISIAIDALIKVNDTFGIEAGDDVLVEIANRLSSFINVNDILSRCGGDEFMIFVHDIGGDLEKILRKFGQTFSRPFQMGDKQIYLTCSIGVSTTNISGYVIDALISQSDMALYHAKRNGRGIVKVYEDTITLASVERMNFENEIRVAMEHGDFELLYQPVVSMHTNKVVGVEALIRWMHPDGVRQPSEFIYITEETNLIVALGEWVLRTACIQAQAWRLKTNLDIGMAVNVSVKQLIAPGFLSLVLRILKETGFPAELLELEMTETVLSGDGDGAKEAIDALRAHRIRVAFDDFGTGYNSLLNLRRCMVDTLKIDRTFVKEIDLNVTDQAIASSLIHVGKNLGMRIVAEGVEQNEHVAILSNLGCEDAQGFLFAYPSKPEVIEAMLLSNQVIIIKSA